MHKELVEILRCPATGGRLKLDSAVSGDTIEEGALVSEVSGKRYPIVRGVPRFVSSDNYAGNFGVQWNKFRTTQLDSHSGQSISSERFWKATGWRASAIAGKLVLDAGCGAGRFAEIAATAGARLIAIDFSTAVDACYTNIGHMPNVDVIQADIFALPFAPETFHFVYSLGVLQHTPDVRRAFQNLVRFVTPGGAMTVDVYWKRLRTMLNSKYLVRPLTKRLDQGRLYRFLERAVPAMLPVVRGAKRIPLVGLGLSRLIPVADYTGIYQLDENQQDEWALLDTFDMLAPQYDKPQTVSTLKRWFREAGFEKIEILQASALVGRGIRPA